MVNIKIKSLAKEVCMIGFYGSPKIKTYLKDDLLNEIGVVQTQYEEQDEGYQAQFTFEVIEFDISNNSQKIEEIIQVVKENKEEYKITEIS